MFGKKWIWSMVITCVKAHKMLSEGCISYLVHMVTKGYDLDLKVNNTQDFWKF